ncbi:complex I subunit 4 family protein [Adhaeribacter aquaticus]|uniref:complex I subunit 4 family protein n=1 Tax=Adhaeribacter aquaticus TaxID=299567 RepID=UPI00041B26A2|nr:NADH-quinone oxidoreductase subunit M [Adhaeribacter aquaticus]
MDYILSSLIFIPLLTVLLILLLPKQMEGAIKSVSLVATILQMVLSCWLFFNFNPTASATTDQGYQFVEKLNWISLNLQSLGHLQIQYFLGVDGISLSMVLLTGLMGVIGVVSSWTIKKNVKAYFALYLLLVASVMGCFLALDLFLFYLFFEFMLLPMYFLIGIWGGPRREYAAIKFFIYTLIGSLLILIVMIGLYTSVIDPAATAVNAGLATNASGATPAIVNQVQSALVSGTLASDKLVHTFSIPDMYQAKNFIPGSILHAFSNIQLWGYPVRLLAFLLLFIGFAIKLPVVPVHTWLPDAHVEAPTPISVLLASLLLKVGGYGLFRIVFPVFPEGAAYYAHLIGGIGVLSIIYGAMCALAMSDLKKLIAYSSVSHMGFVLIGLASLTVEGANGSMYQMFSHGLISGMLFIITGVIYDRSGSRMIQHFRGLAFTMPAFTVLVVIAFFASLGLPGFSGFIAELLVLLGTFASATVSGMLPRWMAIVATSGLLLGAAYYLWALQRMFFGKIWVHPEVQETPNMPDLTRREYLMLVPLAVLTLVFGLFPSLLLDKISPAINQLVQFILVAGK